MAESTASLRKHHYKARLTTKDNEAMPSMVKTPQDLKELFTEYEPKAVHINKRAVLGSIRV